MRPFVILFLAAFAFVCVLPLSAHADDKAKDASVVQKTAQKSPVQNVPKLQVEMPKPEQKAPVQKRQIQKTPVQKEVIQKECCGPCCQKKHRFRFRQRTVIRERGRLFSAHRARVNIRVPGCILSVGGGCCH